MKPSEDESNSLSGNKPEADWDDGRTVAPMDAAWMPWNHGRKAAKHTPANDADASAPKLQLTKAEKRGMVLGALRAAVPVLVILALVAAILYLLARAWLG